ncbi:hypothetical protein N7533_012665 [Penicillium manginii]|uniref:uncharacterized protein n=1 Tax=Penicillium manginii TaxID=203109 RepID=UPI00254860BA|nr:uncharacterized protein N7533_012665 [Penicillium manginii]KAJ5739881.1 hypothetical protein N7533_012665 [Penicillium manginii]
MSDVHWIAPTIGITAASIGIYSIYMAVINYPTDAYERNLGFGWAGTLLGFIGIALSVVPVVLVLKGPQTRARSTFMREAMWEPEEKG